MIFYRTITLIDVLDIAVLAALIYQVLLIFRRTRANQLILGLFYFAFIFLIAYFFQMKATTWVFEKMVGLIAFALLIIFQPELRNFFERAGRRGLLFTATSPTDEKALENMIVTTVQALEELSETHTGAIIVIEREIDLHDYINTGERIDAEIRKDLIKAIFHKGNPLHDGAMIIRGDRIASARSFLPLTESQDIPSHLGTRHRAAMGITEHSDAISLVASEETGHLSMFQAGKPAFRLTPNTLRHMVMGILIPETDRESPYQVFRVSLDRYFRRGPRSSVKEPVAELAEDQTDPLVDDADVTANSDATSKTTGDGHSQGGGAE